MNGKAPHPAPVLVWFRLDLRLGDNPALSAAAASGRPVVPVFIWSPEEEGEWRAGGASLWWLKRSLAALDASLGELGGRLVWMRGPSAGALAELARTTGASAVYYNRRVEPALARQEEAVTAACAALGMEVHGFNGSLLLDPGEVRTKEGRPFQVFTPFWNACLSRMKSVRPLAAPQGIGFPSRSPKSLDLDEPALGPGRPLGAGMEGRWAPGETGAHAALERFLGGALEEYGAGRDRPGGEGTSRLSPHLHFGELSPRQAWAAAESRRGAEAWQRQIVWREFAHHLLAHFPLFPVEPLRAEFARFPWLDDRKGMEAWRRGRTGYPLVDAGMRELRATGWMHNRVRMVAASFLTKHLLLPWREGERWFWDTLVDADLANNAFGWQWTAGCGADAAPYFRIFNPALQAAKFDPDGAYIRRWVPELGRVPAPWLFQPWKAPREVLERAGVEPGRTYPRPIVDHAEARERALAAHRSIR